MSHRNFAKLMYRQSVRVRCLGIFGSSSSVIVTRELKALPISPYGLPGRHSKGVRFCAQIMGLNRATIGAYNSQDGQETGQHGRRGKSGIASDSGRRIGKFRPKHDALEMDAIR